MGNDFELRIDAIHTEFTSGRDMIYKALSDCYDLYCEVLKNKDRQAELKGLFKSRGNKDQTNTDDATRLVRVALVKEAGRANPYVQVIRRAAEAAIRQGGLRKFIEDRGGMENIRLNRHDDDPPKNNEEYERLLEDGRHNLATRSAITTIEDETLLATDNLGMLVVRRRVAGEGPLEVLIEIADDDGLFKSVLAKYAKG